MRKRKNIRLISFLLILSFLIPSGVLANEMGDKEAIICTGEDLTIEERAKVLEFFELENLSEIKEVKIKNEEETQYLGDYIERKKIGTKSISSVYIEKLEEGEGVIVSTHNISWVTEDMYKNALITAGIEDARIIVASPFEVSGTAALVGITKGVEELMGKEIDEKVKDIANQEVVLMGELKDKIGEEKAINLIITIKKETLKKGYKYSGEMDRAVRDIAEELEIELNEEDMEMIINFLIKLSRTNVNKRQIIKKTTKIMKERDLKLGFFENIKVFFMELFSKVN